MKKFSQRNPFNRNATPFDSKTFGRLTFSIVISSSFLLAAGCDKKSATEDRKVETVSITPDKIVGTWKCNVNKETIDIFADGTCQINELDIPVSGSWARLPDGRIKFSYSTHGASTMMLASESGANLYVEQQGVSVAYHRVTAVKYNHEYNIALNNTDNGTTKYAKVVLENRLQAADIPAQFIVLDDTNWAIRVSVPDTMPLSTIRRLITTQGRLTIRMVHPNNSELKTQLAQDGEIQAPAGYEKMLSTSKPKEELYFVSRRRELTVESISDVQYARDEVIIEFDERGKTRLENLTTDYVPGGAKNPSSEGRRFMAVTLDDDLLICVCEIRSVITNGKIVFKTNFNEAWTRELTWIIKGGVLPFQINISQEIKL